ncbi:MAG: hypothetical protein EOO01_26345 [Chitinophagaceae bacterium]|nr:MAG: hypothetical protein EOO01_26345 [Chitinophagaceae bacterium]
MKRKRILILIILVVLLPLWMWLAWLLTPRKKMVMGIIDKTEITTSGQEHVSLTWILNHERFTKTSKDPYRVSQDYFGFFPLEKEAFRLKGLERFNPQQLEQLSNDCSAAYFTDTYGVFSNEWYTGKNITERSGIVYGGMSIEDIRFLTKMKEKHKLIITEFNSIGSPTAPEIRQQFESLFDMKWSGWIGRYFETFDTTLNKELPRWLINNYLAQNNNQWPFTKPGVALVSDKDEVVILEEKTHLENALPHIVTSSKAQSEYGLPANIKYSFWFDVVMPDTAINEVAATFKLDVNAAGQQLLAKRGIPTSFPAVIQHKGSDYQFYYFCADFCDNPVSLTSSYFKGISFFSFLFYNESDAMERKSFFWKYYKPLVSAILSEHYKEVKIQK